MRKGFKLGDGDLARGVMEEARRGEGDVSRETEARPAMVEAFVLEAMHSFIMSRRAELDEVQLVEMMGRNVSVGEFFNSAVRYLEKVTLPKDEKRRNMRILLVGCFIAGYRAGLLHRGL